MLIARHYKPSDSEVLYHYCSPETFLAICTKKRLRFSDLYAMNDWSEMKWGYRIWEEAAGQLLEHLGKPFLDDIDAVIHESGYHGIILASCFSKLGDTLNQWRAYGKDGFGYSIGFNAKSLSKLPVRPLEIEYDKEKQIFEVKAAIQALHICESSGPEPRGQEFIDVCVNLACDLASLKNPEFAEEREVRLIHLLDFEPSPGDHGIRLVDRGGTAFDKDMPGQPVEFHISESTPVAHLDMDFTNLGEVNPIAEVIVGPKNDSILAGISIFLETVGLPGVVVKKSRVPYR